MDSIVRRKLPSRVRSMLTDIRPREEEHLEVETVSEPVDKDGIILPRRVASDTRDLLTPAVRNDTSNNPDGSAQQVCGLCLSKPYSYTCPRCNIMYCSLACYRSPAHSGCSEEFYKESVLEELRNTGMTEKEARQKMQDILLRVRKKEGELEHIAEVLGEEAEPGGAEALELLSKLAEIQTSGEENTEEIQRILSRLQDIEECGEGSIEDDLTEEEGDQDLADKVAGLDIDSLSEEELWALLSRQDREKFEALVKGRAIGGLIPIWKPWWEVHDKPKEVLLEVMSENSTCELVENKVVSDGNEESRELVERSECVTGQKETEQVKGAAQVKKVSKSKTTRPNKPKNKGGQNEVMKEHKSKPCSNVPSVNMSKIPPLHSLTRNPSPLLGNTLINVLYGYTFSMCLFNGDITEEEILQDFCQAVFAISEGLSTNRVFNTLRESLEAAAMAVSAAGYFDREDPQALSRAVEAVAHVLTGPSGRDPIRYSLAALSELRGAMAKARVLLPKEGDGAEARKAFFQATKKCAFLQAWTKENPHAVEMLAAGVWVEHLRREDERKVLEKEKKGVEKNIKKGGGRGTLIEEIN